MKETQVHAQPNEKRRVVLAAFILSGFLPGCGGGSSTGILEPPSSLPTGFSPPDEVPSISLKNLTNKTIYLAHRGSAALFPENTHEAFANSLLNGNFFLEADVQTLADGSLGIMHDFTVERTTTSSGNVAAFSESTWTQLKIDGDAWHGSNFFNTAAPLFSKWVDNFKGKAILVPEDKDLRSTPAIVKTLQEAGVSKEQVLIQAFGIAPLAAAIAAGYQGCYLHSGKAEPKTAIDAGITWTGIDANASETDIQKWTKSGVKVLLWTINRRYIRDAKLSLGVAGFFSDDPEYLRNDAPLSTTDRFGLQTWSPGMLARGGDIARADRGKFFDGGYWGYDTTELGYLGCLMGYLCPIKGHIKPSFYNIDLQVHFGASANNDLTLWASIYIGTDDRPFVDSTTDQTEGYHLLFRRNGGIDLYKKTAGNSTVHLMGTAGSNINEGQEVAYRITVTDRTVTVARLTSEKSEQNSFTCNDASIRGAYIHLGRNGLACKFRKVAIT